MYLQSNIVFHAVYILDVFGARDADIFACLVDQVEKTFEMSFRSWYIIGVSLVDD